MFAIQIGDMTLAFDVARIPQLHLINAADITKRGTGSRQVMAFALLALGTDVLASVAARLPSLGYDLGRLGELAFDALLGAGLDARGSEAAIWGAVSQYVNARRAALSEATAPAPRTAMAPVAVEAPEATPTRRPSAEHGDPPRSSPEGNGPRKLPKALQEAAKT